MDDEEKTLTEIVDELCSGCDVPSMSLRYADNGRQYCPRCYEEVIVLRDYKKVEKYT